MEKPKLRPLEAVPYDENNTVIRDPAGISSKMLLVSRDVLFICSLCDGNHSWQMIQEEWRNLFDGSLDRERLQEVLRQLDDCFFLDNSNFTREKYRIEQDFLTSAVRKPFHAGTGYSENSGELKSYLDEEFGKAGPVSSSPLKGIVAPHIDLSRGIGCYTAVYSPLKQLEETDLVVILGVSHSVSKRSIILTDKDFQTPFGTVRTDKAVMQGLKGHPEYDFFTDELLHRNEHSVEFQVLLTQYVLTTGKEPDRKFTILPVLCSECGNLEEEAAVFADSLLSCLRKEQRVPLIIAGADLSHLGRRFGQEVEMTGEYLAWAEEKDREMLERVCRGDAAGFLAGIREESNSRNVCGVPAIYTLMKLTGPVSTELVCYDQAVDKDADSMVSFAGIWFS